MARFESLVPPGKRGAALVQALENWLEEKRLAELRTQIEEGFKDEENLKLYTNELEWAPPSDEVWSQINDDWSKMSAEEMQKEFNAD